MRRLTLHRLRSTDQGTPGLLVREDGSRLCFTMELPDRANAARISCILPGEYTCHVRRSPHFGEVYTIEAVPGRSNVLLHRGNFAGDVSEGFRTDSQGCVMLGLYAGKLKGQRAVFVAQPAVRKLLDEMNGQPFTLRITWVS